MAYFFKLFDPRPIPAAGEANEKIFNLGDVYGIEVTVPALAARCVMNIDPQHIGNNVHTAAIEEAVFAALPPKGSVLATVGADLDSVGSMAILELRSEGVDLSPILRRIEEVAESDKFAHGGWPGPQPLPSREDPWPLKTASAEAAPQLAAIASAIADFKIPFDQRVEWMKVWLLSGEAPAGYEEKVQKEREELIRALESGEIRMEDRNGIAVVVSTHRAGTTIGYSIAPVAVLLNPEFGFGPGPKVKKFTVCQFEVGYVDLKKVFAELSQVESGWGGSLTIGGSPQGVSSALTLGYVAEIVRKHLL